MLSALCYKSKCGNRAAYITRSLAKLGWHIELFDYNKTKQPTKIKYTKLLTEAQGIASRFCS